MVETSGISVADICFTIGGFSLKDVTFDIPRGEYFVLTGKNGSGKTVFIRILAGLFSPSKGTITINGKEVGDLPPWERNIGYVPQEGVLFPNRSVRGNIVFGLEARKMKKDEMSRRVKETAAMMEITHLLDRKVTGLSGGERQKVSISRALIIEPELLLLDEPVSAIDEEARDQLCKQLKEIQRNMGITTIHVSHNSKETDLVADRIGVMDKGTLQTRNAQNPA